MTYMLCEANGHTGKAAALLNMSRATLWRKRKQYGIGGQGTSG